MRPGLPSKEHPRSCRALVLGACAALLPAGWAALGADRPRGGAVPREYSEARRLFEKLWVTGEAAEAGGDGVGPLFNERSCVGCHHQGGTGGSGDPSNDVVILAAIPGGSAAKAGIALFQGELEELHPGFRNRSSVVLHRHSTAAAEEARLASIKPYGLAQTRDELFTLASSSRSTPALFGSGRIDAIPETALIEAEGREFPAFPEIKGRVSRVRGGRLGRFGWKGQTAGLADFVMAACANELGLEVPGHHQPSLLPAGQYDPKKLALDLTAEDCARLVRFVASLPRPAVRPVAGSDWGSEVFEGIGCAACHAPSLGGVRGLYSDLLLHDLGDRFLAFGGGYGGPTAEVVDRAGGGKDPARPASEAGPTEWRTTPLWGVASSAPYLHDGRAPTLDGAIRLHGGEARATAARYARLAAADRRALLAFLGSQVAPPPPDFAPGKPRAKRP